MLTGYTPLNLDIMRLESVPGFDLYLTGGKGPVLYRNKSLKFTAAVLASLVENGVQYLYFKNDDEGKFNRYIEKNLDLLIDDPAIPGEKKADLAYTVTANLARQLLQRPNSPGLVKRAARALDSIMSFVARDSESYKNLVEAMPQDYHLHTHSANVATYSLALGKVMGLNNSTGLRELTLGSFLHDIGKSKLPQSVLYKKGPLTKDEFEIVKQHVPLGYKIVREIPAVPFGSYTCITQHHERLSGAGYPRGIRNIHINGRIVAVADTFDALTTHRVYQKAVSSYDAISVIKSAIGEYDPDIVNALIQTMAPRKYKLKLCV